MNNDNNEPELIKAPYTLTVMEEVFQGGVLAVVYLFAFVNTRRSRRSRYRYITYYTVLTRKYIYNSLYLWGITINWWLMWIYYD